MSASRDFWQSSGHHLLDRDAHGLLVVTDEFLKAYLARPEIAPPADACQAERALHTSLLRSPRHAITPGQIAAIADSDARENWTLLVQWRDHLVAHATLEGAYLAIVRSGTKVPHLFLNQLVHLILRNALDACTDVFVLRAAELFFRSQKLTLHDGSLVAADEETVSGIATTPLSPLVSMLGLPSAANIDVLNEQNAREYWQRSDRFDMALDLTAGRRGLSALGDVIACWLAHLLALDVTVEALAEIRDAAFSWYVGLDAEGTRIGDALWNGEELDDAGTSQTVGLYRLTFRDHASVLEQLRGEPVYLIAAMSADKVLRLKPQNLLTGLPLKAREAVS
jgi:hypothetical protein